MNRYHKITISILVFSIFINSCYYIIKGPFNKRILLPKNTIVNPRGKPKSSDEFANKISRDVYKNQANAYYSFVVEISESCKIYQYWNIGIGKSTFNFLMTRGDSIVDYNLNKEMVIENIIKSKKISEKIKKLLITRLEKSERVNNEFNNSF